MTMTILAVLICILQLSPGIKYCGDDSESMSPMRATCSHRRQADHLLGFVAWIIMNMTAPVALSSDKDSCGKVPVMVGSPPQEVDMVVTTHSSVVLIAAFAYDCNLNLCPGDTLFDQTRSASFEFRIWSESHPFV